jgi:diguanylate cyclase (GGDEF)-like protein/PAS domain S-box-containing protein
MSRIPGIGLFSLVNRFVDRAIGAEGLSPVVRQNLLHQQLRSVAEMTPAMLAASVAVSIVFLMMSWGTPRFWYLAVTIALILIVQLHSVYLAFVHIRTPAAQVPNKSGGRTVLYAFLLGVAWVVAFNMLPIAQSPAARGVAVIGAGGLACVAMMALVNYPQALTAFVIPLIDGALGLVAAFDTSPDFWAQGALLLLFMFILVTVSFYHAAAFVAHRASETLVEEKGEIIGLLLREFEQSISDWIWGTDADGVINRASAGFTAATGVPEEALMGADFVHFLRCLTPPGDPMFTHLERDIVARQTFQDVNLLVLADGKECWWSLTGKPAFDVEGNYLGYIGTGSDITERKMAERRITMLAHHDSMTGLLNRTKFTEHLNSCVARLERYGTPFAVMFLDLDHFKSVNDSRGHMAGDRLLVQVAKRLGEVMRDTDLAARLGGDEFALILPSECEEHDVTALAERVIATIKEPYSIDDEQVVIGVSVGIAMAPLNGTRPDQILRNADLALYRAKADGRSVYRLFESEMDSEARERRLLEMELRDAISNNELVLYYQPLVSAVDERPVGFEALIRWNHPIRGLVPPAEFIPIAEHSNLIVDIGDWTIVEACKAAVSWPEHLSVAVNLSAKHFRQSDISLIVRKALAISGLAPERLEIEITEGLLMEHPEQVVLKLDEIRALGVSIAMDDFGTGYSSLSYLQKFSFDKIKIDRSFVHASSDNEVSRDILKAIASLGKTLKLKITAEGVETREQADFLAAIACNQLQGFFFSRPLDSIDLPLYLLKNVPGRAAEVKAEAERQLGRLVS